MNWSETSSTPAATVEPVAEFRNANRIPRRDARQVRIPRFPWWTTCSTRTMSGRACWTAWRAWASPTYMQQKLTDISYFDPPRVDAAVEQFGELGSLESAKAVFEIIAPVSGAVTAVNPAVVDNPGLINEDPYGAGWLVELKLTAWPQDQELLLDPAAYADVVKRKAAEE